MPRRKDRDTSKSQNQNAKTNFGIGKIEPLTDTQADAFDAFEDEANLMLHGVAGTGKTFIALYLSLKDIINKVEQKKKVYIVRSVVPTRDMGFLPGNQKEKSRVYEAPYYTICNELFGRGDAYETFKSKNIIEFITTSFIRGITLDNCIVIVDECQNMSGMELHSIMTRVGENCKIIFCGDTRQDDLTSVRKKEESGLSEFMRILKRMDSFEFIEFLEQDIVRSDLVKEYIITRNELGLDWAS
jgi:phosphate starvation-inducible protein PhoH